VEPAGSVVAWGLVDWTGYPNGLIATQVSAGGSFFLAIRPDGTVAAWGYNNHGQCDVPDGLIATQVSAGYYYSLALRPDGTVVAWGNNQFGPRDPPAGLIATQIDTGYYSSVALTGISPRFRRRRAAWMNMERPLF